MTARKKLTKRERLEREKVMDKRRRKRLTRTVGGRRVFGKKVKSRMLRVSSRYADRLLRQAHKSGLSVTEYTLRLARRRA